jgi:hypothetical protein
MKVARASFVRGITAEAERICAGLLGRTVTIEEAQELRSEQVYMLAELFFLLDATKKYNPEAIRNLLSRHNSDMAQLAGDKEKCRIRGVNVDRIRKAIFTEPQIAAIAFNTREIVVGDRIIWRTFFDTISVCKLLATVMSIERCRQSIEKLVNLRLIEEIKTPTTKLIVSKGILEGIFFNHLRALRLP